MHISEPRIVKTPLTAFARAAADSLKESAEFSAPQPSALRRIAHKTKILTDGIAYTTESTYTKGRNALFGLTITATYALYAAAAIDLAVNDPENSYTKRIIENSLTTAQNALKP